MILQIYHCVDLPVWRRQWMDPGRPLPQQTAAHRQQCWYTSHSAALSTIEEEEKNAFQLANPFSCQLLKLSLALYINSTWSPHTSSFDKHMYNHWPVSIFPLSWHKVTKYSFNNTIIHGNTICFFWWMNGGLVVLRHYFDTFSCHLQININLHNNINAKMCFWGSVQGYS